MLPGLVQGEYSDESEVNTLLEEIVEKANRHPASIPDEWLRNKFHQLYIEAYIQNFTINSPLKDNVVSIG